MARTCAVKSARQGYLLEMGMDTEHEALVQGDITVSGTGHYNPNNDALLRLETMTANQVRVSSMPL